MIPGETPKEPLLKFAKRLSILQGTLSRLQPSFALIMRILITYTLSVVDYVFSAIPVQEDWVQPQQIQIKRIACEPLCIPIRTPNKMLWQAWTTWALEFLTYTPAYNANTSEASFSHA